MVAAGTNFHDHDNAAASDTATDDSDDYGNAFYTTTYGEAPTAATASSLTAQVTSCYPSLGCVFFQKKTSTFHSRQFFLLSV